MNIVELFNLLFCTNILKVKFAINWVSIYLFYVNCGISHKKKIGTKTDRNCNENTLTKPVCASKK